MKHIVLLSLFFVGFVIYFIGVMRNITPLTLVGLGTWLPSYVIFMFKLKPK